MKCPNCNATIQPDQRVCPDCGQLFSEDYPSIPDRFGASAISGFIVLLIAGGIGAFTTCCGGIFLPSLLVGNRLYQANARYLTFWPTVSGGAAGALGIFITLYAVYSAHSKHDPAKITIRNAGIVLLILWAFLFLVALSVVR